VRGALHILRRTFCSHLAKRGIPPLFIKELTGHHRTTMRCMHMEKKRSTAQSRDGRRGGGVSIVETFWRRVGA
jgi:integrase